MLSIVTQVVKYLVVLLIAIYALRCFTVFNVRSEQRQRKIYIGQNVLMFLIHLLLNIVIFMNRPNALTVVFYIAQFVFFQVALFLYSNLYKNASRLLINNMFFLLMIGFCMLARLDTALAVKEFLCQDKIHAARLRLSDNDLIISQKYFHLQISPLESCKER